MTKDNPKTTDRWFGISVAINVLLVLAVLAASIWKFTDVRFAVQHLIGGASYEQNNWYEPYTYQARELTGISSCDVCMVGDSLTMYGLWNEFWPDLVVLNRGIGSDTSEGDISTKRTPQNKQTHK